MITDDELHKLAHKHSNATDAMRELSNPLYEEIDKLRAELSESIEDNLRKDADYQYQRAEAAERENAVLREQNFAMNKRIVDGAGSVINLTESMEYPEPPRYVLNVIDYHNGCAAYRNAIREAAKESAATQGVTCAINYAVSDCGELVSDEAQSGSSGTGSDAKQDSATAADPVTSERCKGRYISLDGYGQTRWICTCAAIDESRCVLTAADPAPVIDTSDLRNGQGWEFFPDGSVRALPAEQPTIVCANRTGCETPNDCREHKCCRSPHASDAETGAALNAEVDNRERLKAELARYQSAELPQEPHSWQEYDNENKVAYRYAMWRSDYDALRLYAARVTAERDAAVAELKRFDTDSRLLCDNIKLRYYGKEQDRKP